MGDILAIIAIDMDDNIELLVPEVHGDLELKDGAFLVTGCRSASLDPMVKENDIIVSLEFKPILP